jgi:hypothetical protein
VNVVCKLWCRKVCVLERYKNVEDMRRMNVYEDYVSLINIKNVKDLGMILKCIDLRRMDVVHKL